MNAPSHVVDKASWYVEREMYSEAERILREAGVSHAERETRKLQADREERLGNALLAYSLRLWSMGAYS